jgi:hypothetical protein
VEHNDLTRRLRASLPAVGRVDERAFDQHLLDRVRTQPIAPRRGLPRAVALPVAAAVALAATVVVMLAGGPGDVGGPPSAAAITAQTLHWLSPPAGTILHARSVETQGGRATPREFWQSADDPASARELVDGPQGTYETEGESLYDPARNTIYDAGAKPSPPAKPGTLGPGRVPADGTLPSGDPIVTKVRILLQDGQMRVSGEEVHNGVDAYAVSLKPDAGRPVWTLWVAAADGRPLELRDPGRDANEQPQVIRWPTYEVQSGGGAALLTLRGAHPSARVVHDPAQLDAARQRLGLAKP